MTTATDPTDADTNAPAEPPTPADLRAQAGRLFNAVTRPARYPLLREGDVLIGHVATRGARIVALVRKPATVDHCGKIVLQAAHAGPDGRMVPSSGAAIAFDTATLPLFAALVARAMEVELREARAFHRARPIAPALAVDRAGPGETESASVSRQPEPGDQPASGLLSEESAP